MRCLGNQDLSRMLDELVAFSAPVCCLCLLHLRVVLASHDKLLLLLCCLQLWLVQKVYGSAACHRLAVSSFTLLCWCRAGVDAAAIVSHAVVCWTSWQRVRAMKTKCRLCCVVHVVSLQEVIGSVLIFNFGSSEFCNRHSCSSA